jgi:hypothetical protein
MKILSYKFLSEPRESSNWKAFIYATDQENNVKFLFRGKIDKDFLNFSQEEFR